MEEEDNQPLVPYFNPEEKAALRGTKVIYSCLPPDEWGGEIPVRRTSLEHNYPPELVSKVLSRWREYGFDQYSPGPVEGSLGRTL